MCRWQLQWTVDLLCAVESCSGMLAVAVSSNQFLCEEGSCSVHLKVTVCCRCGQLLCEVGSICVQWAVAVYSGRLRCGEGSGSKNFFMSEICSISILIISLSSQLHCNLHSCL